MGKTYNITICGGGLAGLTLARQLRLWHPDVNITVIEKSQSPLPLAAHKVGESTVVMGGTYLSKTLELKSYLLENQLEKFGLRYFFKHNNHYTPFHLRPELGRDSYNDAIHEYQLDRGKFEQDLRDMLIKDNVKIVENAIVKEISIIKNKQNKVTYKSLSTGEVKTVTSNWVVDAMGRRQFLSRQLGVYQKPENNHCSSVWFRFKQKIKVDNFVTKDHKEWFERVKIDHPTASEFGRYNSTNHLMGKGYWVWLIPLSTGYTSIGIVFDERLHSFDQFNTVESSMNWLKTYERDLASIIESIPIEDFKKSKTYSLLSSQVISSDGWALSGEAAAFLDPFYSPGTDSIAYMNSVICHAIGLDKKSSFTEAIAKAISNEYLTWAKATTKVIQSGYPMFGNPKISTIKIIFDVVYGKAFQIPRFQVLSKESDFVSSVTTRYTDRFSKDVDYFKLLIDKGIALFNDWELLSPNRFAFTWIDYLKDFHFLEAKELTTKTLTSDTRTFDEILSEGISRLEIYLVVVYLLAIEDISGQPHTEFIPKPAEINLKTGLSSKDISPPPQAESAEFIETCLSMYSEVALMLRMKQTTTEQCQPII